MGDLKAERGFYSGTYYAASSHGWTDFFFPTALHNKRTHADFDPCLSSGIPIAAAAACTRSNNSCTSAVSLHEFHEAGSVLSPALRSHSARSQTCLKAFRRPASVSFTACTSWPHVFKEIGGSFPHASARRFPTLRHLTFLFAWPSWFKAL